jgi:hypothetical protein
MRRLAVQLCHHAAISSTPCAGNKAPAIAGLRKWLTDAGRAIEAMLSDYLQ